MSREGSTTGSRVTLHVVSSLDGFIARKDNSISWLDVNGSAYEAGVSISEEEAATFVKTIDLLCQRFLELGLVDEIRLSIAPVLLGDGLRLFGGYLTEERWDLKNVVGYKNGFVELSYAVSSV
jgi:dihydrofolate reductase